MHNYRGTFCVMLVVISSCRNDIKQRATATSEKYFYKGELLVKEMYDSSKKLAIKQTFTKDTVPYGAKISYDSNGNVDKWEWFLHSLKYPDCIVYYKSNGTFDTLVGNPFISTGFDKKHQLCVKLVNPPNLNMVVTYQDSFQNKLLKDIYYPVLSTDSVAYIALRDHTPKKNHKYMLNFHIVDSSNYYILSDFPIKLENSEDSNVMPKMEINKAIEVVR